jgi:hypothetical protein
VVVSLRVRLGALLQHLLRQFFTYFHNMSLVEIDLSERYARIVTLPSAPSQSKTIFDFVAVVLASRASF